MKKLACLLIALALFAVPLTSRAAEGTTEDPTPTIVTEPTTEPTETTEPTQPTQPVSPNSNDFHDDTL